MAIKTREVHARLKETDYTKLTYLQQTYETTKSDIIRISIENLLCKNTFIENFSFSGAGYDFKQIDGTKYIVSKKGFFVEFWNDEDFRFKGNIAYEIYIPFSYLKEHTGLNSYEEYYKNEITEKGYSIDDIHDFISDIRSEVEEEILNYLEQNNLVEEIEF